MTAAKEKGLVIRLEGKDYVVKDGDIMLLDLTFNRYRNMIKPVDSLFSNEEQ